MASPQMPEVFQSNLNLALWFSGKKQSPAFFSRTTIQPGELLLLLTDLSICTWD